MTTPALLGGWTPISDHNAIPGALARKLAANAQVGKGQLVMISPSTGYASLADGAVPDQISGGSADVSELSDTSATAGAASCRLSERWFYGLAMGTSTDAFTDADFAVPFYAKDENTLGKLSNLGGSNRSLGGLVFGLHPLDGSPVAWAGPIAWLLARSTSAVNAIIDGEYDKAIDAGAATDIAETLVPRGKYHGKISAIEFQVAGTTLAASGATNYKTINVYKREGITGGTQVLVGTVDTQVTAFTKFTKVAFTLSAVAGALDLLETDILTFEETHASAGAIIPAGTIVVYTKVQ